MNDSTHQWQIIIDRKAQRALRRLPKDVLKHISQHIQDLRLNPRPAGCRKLSGTEELYRIRVGDWRIVYAIEDERLVILIINIGPRGSIYRDL